MSESLKKAVLTKSGCDFNIDGMKLFRFHVSSYADCFYTNKLPDSSGKYLSFILCSTGKIRIRLLNGQIISAHQQEIVCVSEKVCVSLSDTEKETSGFLLTVEIPKIQNRLCAITKIIGNWNLDIHLALQYAEQMNGGFLIKGNPWVFSLFSVLNILDDTEQDCYCAWKCIELLYLLSQKMIQVQQVEMLQKNGSVHDRLRSVCSYMGSSRYDQIVTMIEKSEQMKSAVESKAANLADKLVPYTFAGSILSFLLTRNILRALSVLMVDFSCALKFSMPLAVLSAMREAGREHITVKGGKFLEAVAAADTIIFDKTGTLTHACPKVAQIITFGERKESDMLRLAACLEEHFPHSIANAVVQEAQCRGLSHEELHSKVEYLVAHGIASTVNEEKVLIGSAHFIFEDEGVTIPLNEQERFDHLPEEYSHLYLAIGGELAAVICISDPLRSEAKEVLTALRALGIQKTVMLTGDSYRTASAVANRLGVDTFCAEVLPADKAKFVADLRREGHVVLMVGDGINDSPALSEADAGIAISDGAAIAREISDITISAESLWELVKLREIAIALMERIRSNYRFVIGFNGTLIGLGLAGSLSPAASAALHNLSTLGVSLRSMSALPKPKRDNGCCI